MKYVTDNYNLKPDVYYMHYEPKGTYTQTSPSGMMTTDAGIVNIFKISWTDLGWIKMYSTDFYELNKDEVLMHVADQV